MVAMKRALEPDELMDETDQAAAYAASDFTEAHEAFVTRFSQVFPSFHAGLVADLCCGPADPTIRFARRYPGVSIIGYDGAESMLALGRRAVEAAGLTARITLKQQMLPISGDDGVQKFDVVLCNGSMHHLPSSRTLWETVKNIGRPGTMVFVRDLKRPRTQKSLQGIVELCSKPSDPDLMKRDLRNSLRAAFVPSEVRSQLGEAGLSYFQIEQTPARLMIYGVLR